VLCAGTGKKSKKMLALSSKPWTKCLLGDMEELNIKGIKALEDFQEEGIIP